MLFLVGLFSAMLVIGWLIRRTEDKYKLEQKTKLQAKLIDDEFDRMQRAKNDISH